MSLNHECMFCKQWFTYVHVSITEEYKEIDVTVRISGETTTIRARRCGTLHVYTSGHFGCEAWEESEEPWVQDLKKRKERMDREKVETLLQDEPEEVKPGIAKAKNREDIHDPIFGGLIEPLGADLRRIRITHQKDVERGQRAYRFPLTKVIESNVVRGFCEGQQRML